MSYSYESQKHELFTDQGQRLFLRVRDQAQKLLKMAGAFRMGEVLKGISSGDSYDQLACVDRLVELGEIEELSRGENCWGQYRVFTLPGARND